MEYIFIATLICAVWATAVTMSKNTTETEKSTVVRQTKNASHIVIFEWEDEWCFIKHVKPGFVTTESAVLSKNARALLNDFIQSGDYVYIR